MVAVLVRNDDGVQRFREFADGGEALEGLLAAEPGINEDPGASGADKRAVSGAARSQYADFQSVGPRFRTSCSILDDDSCSRLAGLDTSHERL
jgi:hypothetical protein